MRYLSNLLQGQAPLSRCVELLSRHILPAVKDDASLPQLTQYVEHVAVGVLVEEVLKGGGAALGLVRGVLLTTSYPTEPSPKVPAGGCCRV
jgi:hypothetical protein